MFLLAALAVASAATTAMTSATTMALKDPAQ